jgi:RHS repeat-associated protein
LAQSERVFSGGSITNSQFAYLHADHIGTPRLATNGIGAIVWRWDSDAFGRGAANLDPDGDTTQMNVRLRFPGQYLDEETGLHYNYFRDYDPVIGRYVESDPIGLRGGLDTYAYAAGNPLSRIDLLGLADIPAPTDGAGNPLPPPVALPPGKNSEPNNWVPVPGTGSRETKWKPRFPVPSATGSQPGASWDPEGHWDVDDGSGGRRRFDPEGTEVDHDGNPVSSSVSQMCGEDCVQTGVAVIATGGALYFMYRCARMIPSLAPPLWWTIPGNLAIP